MERSIIRNAKVVSSILALGNHFYLLRGMLEGNSFDPLLLDATVKPLPWTKGGPNEDNMQQQPTSNLINSSVADPIFTIKNRVVTMKELCACGESA